MDVVLVEGSFLLIGCEMFCSLNMMHNWEDVFGTGHKDSEAC